MGTCGCRCSTCTHNYCDGECEDCECNWGGECYCEQCGFDCIGQCIYYKRKEVKNGRCEDSQEIG